MSNLNLKQSTPAHKTSKPSKSILAKKLKASALRRPSSFKLSKETQDDIDHELKSCDNKSSPEEETKNLNYLVRLFQAKREDFDNPVHFPVNWQQDCQVLAKMKIPNLKILKTAFYRAFEDAISDRTYFMATDEKSNFYHQIIHKTKYGWSEKCMGHLRTVMPNILPATKAERHFYLKHCIRSVSISDDARKWKFPVNLEPHLEALAELEVHNFNIYKHALKEVMGEPCYKTTYKIDMKALLIKTKQELTAAKIMNTNNAKFSY